MTSIRCNNENCQWWGSNGYCTRLSIVLDLGKFEGDNELQCLDFAWRIQ
jgi:hypothetical protein